MAVHRLDDRAEFLLRHIAEARGQTPAEFLNQLVKEYAVGLSFSPDPIVDVIAGMVRA